MSKGATAERFREDRGGMRVRARNWWAGLAALPALARPGNRLLWAEMRGYVRDLPAALSEPLPEALRRQTPSAADLRLRPESVRRLADAAALVERDSPLGLCLRRSLVRYHYLRRAGLPLTLNFGARFTGGQADRDVTGHAWVTLDGQPYFEDGDNYRGFAVVITFPEGENA